MVGAVVCEWLQKILGPHAATHGYGKDVRKLMATFYADDALMASRDPAMLQESLDVMVGLFERVGLRTNTAKTKVMICAWKDTHPSLPGVIQQQHRRFSRRGGTPNNVG